MGRIATGWDLAKRSWAVLANDRSLMWFPVLSTVFSLLAFASIAGIGVAANWSAIGDTASTVSSSGTTTDDGIPLALYVCFAIAGYVCTTIAVFFNVALVSCVTRSIDGHDTTVSEGIAAARARLGVIIKWAVFAYTVGLILRAIEERVPLGGRIAVWLAGAAWALATLLVIPVLAFEGLGPLDALKRSAGLFKSRFGEVAVGRGAIAIAVFLVAALPAVVLMILGGLAAGANIVLAGLLFALAVGVLIVGSIVGSTLTQIFNTALYRYAADGSSSLGFSSTDFAGVMKPR